MLMLCLVYICVICFMLVLCRVVRMFVFFKQKTADEMRISDWSSDVCSSDLQLVIYPRPIFRRAMEHNAASLILVHNHPSGDATPSEEDRQSVVQGKSVSVRVDLGGRRIIK